MITSKADAMTTGAKVVSRDMAPESYLPPLSGEWTYEDYARLPDNGFRYEVIRGALYMSPAPRPDHQRAAFNLAYHIRTFLEANPVGEVLIAPIDVVLPGLATPVQPDLVFVSADRSEIVSRQRVEAPPDMIVEVSSPGTVERDRRIKFEVYAAAGVREYWIVDPTPASCSIEVYVLRDEANALLGQFGPDDTVRSEVLRGFGVRAGDVCPA